MIKVRIETNGKHIADEFTKKDVTLSEVALVIIRLEQAKQKLLEIDFNNEVEFIEDA